MKRVLIFSLNYFPRFVGGAEIAIKEITDRIAPEEFEFHILTLRFDSALPVEEKIGNVVVHRIGPALPHPSIADLRRFPLYLAKQWYQFAAAGHALKLNRQHKFDGIWAMMAHSCGIPAGITKRFQPELPYLLTLQEGDPPRHIERLMKPVWPLFTQAFTRADELQAISNFLLAWGKRRGFTGEGVIIPNGVDGKKFAHPFSNEEITQAKRALGKKESEVFLITTSRLVRKNAIDTIIESLAYLPEQISLLVFGIGPEEAALRTLAQTLKIEHRVRFMGEIDHGSLPLILRAADIFVRPSRSEGMGNSFIEAMAAGLPVIATQEGGISDFLFDAVRNPDKEPTGWAVDVDAPEQVAQAVQNIVSNPEIVREVTARAQKKALSEYDWDHVAARMKELFVKTFA